MDSIRKFSKTYALLRSLGAINGSKINGGFLDKVLYNFESLPPLGKEYWWFLFFGEDRRQLMVMLFRKSGRSIVFNDKKYVLKKIEDDSYRGVTAGWVYHGGKMHDLGDSNSIISIKPRDKVLFSNISGRDFYLKGGFPEYDMSIEGLVNLRMSLGGFLENKCAYGVFIPPFGTGWIGIYSKVEGEIFGERFKGTGHLQKVVGVMPYGSFHWARIVFQKGSVVSFFCLRAGRDLNTYFFGSMHFFDMDRRKHIEFDRPKLRISAVKGKNLMWIVSGNDAGNELKMVLDVYAEKKYVLNGRGSQIYIEYAVVPVEFSFKSQECRVLLKDLGDGIGTFEDAYTTLF